MREVDVVAAEPALGEHRRDVGRKRCGALVGRIDHHAGEARRQRQGAQAAALVGDAAVGVDRAEIAQQRLGLGKRRLRRRIEEGKRRRIGHAPMREIEHETGEIGGEDFRLA